MGAEENPPLANILSQQDREFHEKYAFIIGLLKRPSCVLVRECLQVERDKLVGKLAAYTLERNLLRQKVKSTEGIRLSEDESLCGQMKHLDMMCITLERQIQVFGNIEQTLPPTENVYCGEPDSLDGTSSEAMEEEDDGVCVGGNFRLGRSPLDAFALLHLERCAHGETRKELNNLRKKYELLRDEFDSGEGLSNSLLFSHLTQGNRDDDLYSGSLEGSGESCESGGSRLAAAVRDKDSTIHQLRLRLLHLEKSHIESNIPIDAASEITRLHSTLVQLERVRDELTLQNLTLKSKLVELSSRISDNATYRLEGAKFKTMILEGGDEECRLRRKSTYKVGSREEGEEAQGLRATLHRRELELRTVMEDLEEARNGREEAEERVRATDKCFASKEQETAAIKLDLDTLKEENRRLRDDLNLLHIKSEAEERRAHEKNIRLEKEIGSLVEAGKTLGEEVQRERLLRIRYYNQVEDLKGKIRVFARLRPPSKNERGMIVARASDSYTLALDTAKGGKEFNFDRVFGPNDSQETIFNDTQKLIQSAFDGYNVCICAYGQTGSGKTHTILGDENSPGIAPRTFHEIFRLAEDNSSTTNTFVSFYVLELYNDKLIDLLSQGKEGGSFGGASMGFSTIESNEPQKLEIRRDRRGTVWVSGARVMTAEDADCLERNFRTALTSRHVATTKMNERSSRSHLIIGLLIESTSKVNGGVLRGKISLVDLAGSERTGKSGVSADTLREANAINKSLSAFGDVINALTTDQSFVPYRNNKLTQLMQDSIGGNAKTLMFVNVSPLAFNVDESLVSLTYASRVKQVSNGPTRNSDTKEVSRLKNIISRLKRGENVEEDLPT